MDISSVARTGLFQASAKLDGIARRVSNASGQEDAVELSTEAVNLIQVKNEFKANLKLLQNFDDLDKSTLRMMTP